MSISNQEALWKLSQIPERRALLDELEEALLTIVELTTKNVNSGVSDTEAVRETVTYMKGAFTMADLHREMEEGGLYLAPAKTSLSAILSRLAKDGEIAIVEQGNGRRASVYRRNSEEPAEQPT